MKQFLYLCLLIVSLSRGIFAGAAPPTAGLKFIENKGQITDQYGASRPDIVAKIATSNGLNVFVGAGALHYQWTKSGNEKTDMYRMDVTLLGADARAPFTIEKPRIYHERYYLPSAAGVVAGAFGKLVFHDIYPHIDWVLYVDPEGSFKYDFIVRPGGNPLDIRLQYGGADGLTLGKDHHLTAVTPLGSITEQAPYSYQLQNGKEVSSSFHLEGNVLSFTVDTCDGTLVIDPTIAWGTYFGGSDYDDINGVATGKDGFVYAVGATNSVSNIATTGAYQTTFAGGINSGGSDALLCKLSPSGDLLWATYYGGTDADLGKKIAVDTAGAVYIAGWAGSTSGIATTGSYQQTRAGGADRYNAFLAKFDTSGQRIWGTYCGGSNDANTANPLDVCADNTGSIFLAFTTESSDLITTSGAYQSTLNGYDNAFLAKFDVSGQLAWATYYGGETADYPYVVATDITGNVYLAGRTQSTTGIASINAYQASNNGGQDAFLAKFNPAGQFVWGTYCGGSGLDRGYGVTTDSIGEIYLAGTTNSASGIATPGAYQSTLAGTDGFLTKFDANGQRIWGTYYGGPGSESMWAVRAAGNNSIYCTGQTSSASAMTTADAPQQVFGGSVDAFAARFDSSGALHWGSYIGGQDGDVGFAVCSDSHGHVYVGGRTNSAAGIATGNSAQGDFAGGTYDGFLVKLNDCSIPGAPATIDGPGAVCAGATQTYTANFAGADYYHWQMPASWSGSSQTGNITIVFDEVSGVLKVAAENACGISDTSEVSITVNPLPDTPVITQNNAVLSASGGYASYQWNKDGQPISGANGQTYTPVAGGAYTVTVTNEQGCGATSASVEISTTGITAALSGKGIYVYPNPSSDRLNIYLPESCTVSITGNEGRQLQRLVLSKGTHSISLASYATGLYLVQVYTAEGDLIGSTKISKIQ